MGVIKRLPESVVNRIAAGEVVVRPANAVKELIENSLDAGATEVIVTIQQGGLALLQVQDNGKGIQKEDLEVVCERFATSKLEQFEDLQAMRTYGFRGEALASISLVSKVSITSRPKGQQCAYQAKYEDCRMLSVKPIAGNEGTCISAEDLFYNATSRKQAFRNFGEEAAKVADVVTKYAVHRPDVSFAVRRGGGSDFRTKGDGIRSSVVSALIGPECSQNMLEIDHTSEILKYQLSGCLSEPLSAATARSVQAKKNRQKSFFLFINGRSVQCGPLKYAVDALFSDRDLVCPFVLLSLELEPSRVDVNVHPTKQNVVFLEEEAIVEDIREYLGKLVPGAVDTQLAPMTIPTPTQIKRIPFLTQSDRVKSSENDVSMDGSPRSEKRLYDHQMVRTDNREQSLHSFVTSVTPSRSAGDVTMVPVSSSQSEEVQYSQEEDGSCRREFSLESLSNLRRRICAGSSQSLRELLKGHSFVGCVDPEQVLLQHSTSLYVMNLKKVAEEMFYQIAVFGFGNFGCFRLEEPILVKELFLMTTRFDGLTEGDAQMAEQLLGENAEMLHDYLSVVFEMGDEGLQLVGIPSLISGYLPQLEGLADLLCDLVHVSWEEEEDCFHGLCLALARFFAIKADFCQGGQISGLSESADWRSVVRDLLMPRIKSRLIPQERFKEDKVLTRATDLHDLYKVFERC